MMIGKLTRAVLEWVVVPGPAYQLDVDVESVSG